jgi:hypothetical protein
MWAAGVAPSLVLRNRLTSRVVAAAAIAEPINGKDTILDSHLTHAGSAVVVDLFPLSTHLRALAGLRLRLRV